jgi:hypothetical protein
MANTAKKTAAAKKIEVAACGIPHRKPTARDQYSALEAEIFEQLVELKKRVQAHARRAAKNDGHWGFVGDLTYTRNNLADTINCFAPVKGPELFEVKKADGSVVEVTVPGRDS